MIRNQFRIQPVQRPDEMTFKQLLEHATRSMYWDPANELWTCVTIVDREFWDVLVNQLEEAHDRETGAAMSENAELRELLVDAVEVADDYYYCGGVKDDLDAIKADVKELGIEVRDES